MTVIIPQPRTLESLRGTLAVGDLTAIFLPPDAGALDLEAARLIQEEVHAQNGELLPISRAWRPAATRGVIALGTPAALAAALPDAGPLPDLPADPEAYALVIGGRCVRLAADDPRGRLWAAQSFRQLLRAQGHTLRNARISDAPALRHRGLLLDVARRKVPHLETLKALVDTLSLLKYNMLQLQVEHTFRFRRHPRIGMGCDPLTCEDLLALDAHCRLRGVELVPMLQSFGHMRNILMLDDYRHLAENPAFQWSLCPTDPASLRFLDELYEEFLPCFSSGLVNIGCDETVDLGRPGGRSNAAIAEKGKGRVYLEFILGLHDLLTTKYGKRVMCWGDVVLHYPELIPELPKDLIVLNWDYDPRDRYEHVRTFADSGLQQIVCPSVSSQLAVFPQLNKSWRNVAHFVRDGKEAGALGMLHTDWGDGGHFNLLGNSYYSYAQAADTAWAAQPLSRTEFDGALGPVLFGTDGKHVVEAIRRLGDLSDHPAFALPYGNLLPAMLFTSPLEDARLREVPRDVLEAEGAAAREEGHRLEKSVLTDYEPSAVLDMVWAADAVVYLMRKTAFLQDVIALAEGGGDAGGLLARGEALLEEHDAVVADFRERWHETSRHSEIGIVLGKFHHARGVLDLVSGWLRDQREALAAGRPVALPDVPAYQTPWEEDVAALWAPDAAEAPGA